ncbi:MAG TPA: hypothetical protein QF753_20705, partial [Victivallales bacterium]|nr:hypothetical protein [Victivallales bacterium]
LCLASRQFNELKIYHIDVLKHMSKFFRKVYADSYINIVSKSPNLYRHLYDMTDHDKDTKVIMNHMRYFLENLFTLFLRNQLKKSNLTVLFLRIFFLLNILKEPEQKINTPKHMQ